MRVRIRIRIRTWIGIDDSTQCRYSWSNWMCLSLHSNAWRVRTWLPRSPWGSSWLVWCSYKGHNRYANNMTRSQTDGSQMWERRYESRWFPFYSPPELTAKTKTPTSAKIVTKGFKKVFMFVCFSSVYAIGESAALQCSSSQFMRLLDLSSLYDVFDVRVCVCSFVCFSVTQHFAFGIYIKCFCRSVFAFGIYIQCFCRSVSPLCSTLPLEFYIVYKRWKCSYYT